MEIKLDKPQLDQLKIFGLTYLQAKVYVSSYLLGEAPVKKIIDACGMHKTEVYRVLKELENLGAVDRVITHPVKYRARQPEEVLTNLSLLHVERLAKLNDAKPEILEWFRTSRLREHDKRQDDDGFDLLRGRFVLKRIVEMFDRASDEILFLFRAQDDVELEVTNSFNRAIERGVKAKGVINVTKQNVDRVKRLKKSPRIIRHYSDKVYSWVIIIDGRETIFGSAPYALRNEEFLYTRNRRFIKHLIKTFEHLFKDTVPIEYRIQELEWTPPPTISCQTAE